MPLKVKFLKGLALAILSLLLFLSLSIFGIAFMLNQTILNPHFITSEINRLNISSLAEELLSQETTQEEFPPELRSTLVDTINKLEPAVKEQIGIVIYSTYDYLEGKSQNLDLTAGLKSDFAISIVQELDISSLAKAFIAEQGTEGIPEEMKYFVPYIDDAIPALEPWIKEQATTAIPPIFDYLLGRSQSFNVVIPLEPAITKLREPVRTAFLKSPPPELASLPPDQLGQYFDAYFSDLTKMMPPTIEINEKTWGAELRAQIAEAISETEKTLSPARQYIGYFQLGYKALIGFMLFLILCIILIYRQVKGATRNLGTIFLTYGVIEYGGIFAAKYFAGTQLPQLDMPVYLQTWLPQLLSDFLAPLEMLILGLLISGIALIIVSFVYKPRQPSS